MATTRAELRAMPSIPVSSTVITSCAEIDIDAPADEVFDILLDNDNYPSWNTWAPELKLQAGERLEVGSTPMLLVKMPAQNREYKIPVKILEVDRSPQICRLSWQSQALPSWAATIERVQEVEVLTATRCRLRSWESMAGLAAYVMKYLMRIQPQLDDGNRRIANYKASALNRLESYTNTLEYR